MRKRVALASLMSFILLLGGCGPGASDFRVKVKNDLFLSQINPQQVLLVHGDDSIIIDNSSNTDVSRGISELDWDEEYLVAKSEIVDVDVSDKESKPLYWVYDIKKDKLDGKLDKTKFEKLLVNKGITLKLETFKQRIKGEKRLYD
ncbi:hypothetical protein [Paenilisteria rocourtiae]|uniref:Uncharacterized protein n=1 Tax=Listeria rocourtiae TaxID=647910 RepID=A0A4R6ZR36_9LIST|nr:hypothetical protein [Listeria rocourtiae]EUJ43213.1 hypothetical protein PROCOU_15669 [Listeria rocourtiae FSL F6-920]TDR54609.1 hypothetical protein DFP96_102197 [Listeria rocourtiae]